MGIQHEQGMHRLALAADGHQIVAVAQGGIAVLVEEVLLSAVVGQEAVDEIHLNLHILLLMVAPDGAPGDAEGIHVIRQSGVGLGLVGHGQVAGDGDEVGLHPLHQGADGVIHHVVTVVIPGIGFVVVVFIQLHVGDVQYGEAVPLHFESEHGTSLQSVLFSIVAKLRRYCNCEMLQTTIQFPSVGRFAN